MTPTARTWLLLLALFLSGLVLGWEGHGYYFLHESSEASTPAPPQGQTGSGG